MRPGSEPTSPPPPAEHQSQPQPETGAADPAEACRTLTRRSDLCHQPRPVLVTNC